jgi:hypothetical protein
MNNMTQPPAETVKTAPVEPLLYDINQSAAALNCCTKSVRNLIRRGYFKPCKVLRKVLIPRKQIEEFIKLTCGTPKPLF